MKRAPQRDPKGHGVHRACAHANGPPTPKATNATQHHAGTTQATAPEERHRHRLSEEKDRFWDTGGRGATGGERRQRAPYRKYGVCGLPSSG